MATLTYTGAMGISLEKKQAALKTGQLGEQLASDFLLQRGYEILERNLKNNTGRRMGEIDIVAMKENELVFVEVKTIVASTRYVSLPEQQITSSKMRKLAKIAQLYVKNRDLWEFSYRFDAIAITLKPETTTASVRHLKNIFL
jgi:putative endonuclease